MSFRDALHSEGPAPDRKNDLYAFLVGSWTADVITHDAAGAHRGTCAIDAGWVLGGRAIQDVWRIEKPLPVAGAWYGTTLRIYDPSIDAWRIAWSDPATNNFYQQIGRARGDDIVQESEDGPDGRSRWSFTKITPASFHWLGEFSRDHGATWMLLVEVIARRA